MANYKHNIILGLDARTFMAESDKIQGSIRKMQTGFMKMAGIFTTAFASVESLRFVADMEQLGVEVANVNKAFQRLNNGNLLDQLREATRGLVSDLDLMKQAVKFENFNLPLERMGQYLSFAQKRAAETGESIDWLVDSIVTGLGRGSIRVLDNLQIDVGKFNQLLQEGMSYADALSTLMAEDMAGGTDLAVSSVQKLTVELQNLKNEAAVALSPFVQSLIDIGKWIYNNLPSMYLLRKEVEYLKDKGTVGLTKQQAGLSNMLKAYQKETGIDLGYNTGITTDDGSGDPPKKPDDWFNEAAHAARAWAAAQAELNNMVNFTNVSLNDLGNTMTMIELDEMEAEFLRVAETLEDLPAKVDAATQSYMWLGEAFNQMFSTALQSGKGFFEQMGAWIENFIKRMLAAAAAAAALNLILPGSTTFMSAFSALSGLRGLTMMAHGGIVDRPTPVIAGEAGPEAIIPLHKLNSMGGTLTTRISGRDLLLILEREQTAKGRLYG